MINKISNDALAPMWKVTAYRPDGTMIELSFDTRAAAYEMYDMLTADNEFSGYKMESPILTSVE